MTWSYYLSQLEGRTAGTLLDDGFANSSPIDSLPHLAWFGIYCRIDPVVAFWAPEEAEALDDIERELIRLCERFANGWAVYVRRLDTRGIREYYFYYGDGAEFDQVLPALQTAHPQYRIEFDACSDPGWSQYRSWITLMRTVTSTPGRFRRLWKRLVGGES